MKSKPLPKSNEKVCGVLKTAGFDAIKKVYRENILKHHPDKLVNASKEEKNKHEQILIEIQREFNEYREEIKISNIENIAPVKVIQDSYIRCKCDLPARLLTNSQNGTQFYGCARYNEGGRACSFTKSLVERNELFYKHFENQWCNNKIDPVPLTCGCNKQAVKLTVSKDNIRNSGKKYLRCKTRGCNFFSWHNGPKKCQCGKQASIFIAKRTTCIGQKYYACKSDSCRFFEWDDFVIPGIPILK